MEENESYDSVKNCAVDKTCYNFQKIIVVVGSILLILKFIAWVMTGSVAILTDALESIVNVVAAFVGLYALYLSSKPADSEHPFGHGRVEIISSGLEGMMILGAGILIIFESVGNLINPKEISSLDIGIILVAIAAVANYAMGRIAIRKGEKYRSPALVASGKHLCSDTYSSIGIIIGLFVVYLALGAGYDARWLDSGIAIIFGVIIIVTGIKVIKNSFDSVMDSADYDLLSEVVEVINEKRHDDWIDIHHLRINKYGPALHIILHMTFPKSQTIEWEEKEISELVEGIEEHFGGRVEFSVVADPCIAENCYICKRTCNERSSEFTGYEIWTVESLIDDPKHR